MRSRHGWILLAPAVLSAVVGAQVVRPAEGPGLERTFTMALTGDSILTRRLSVYTEPPFLGLVDLIRGADVAFTNLEMLFHDYESYPMHESGGTYMRADPALLRDLAWAGFDLVSRANNHAGDYGVEGMRITSRHVAEAGLVQAGVGESLDQAREARFLETTRGRVALISVASTFPGHSRASASRGDMPARPGLNPLRFSTTYILPPDQIEALRGIARQLKLNVAGEGAELRMLGARFAAGDQPGVRTVPDADDVREIAAVVRGASRLADYTIVTIHAHERGETNFEPAAFLPVFARAMIDAGASVLVGHGPHVLRGIEIYKGRPIFYSLGDLIFQNETVLRLPAENYDRYRLDDEAQVADFNDARYDFDRRGFPAQREIWEGLVASPVWRDGSLIELTLHPVVLGFGRPPAERGRPMLAQADAARKIIADVERLSKPFGTTIVYDNGVGRVRVGTAAASPQDEEQEDRR
jgi:poly-gamma-glutamate capsule biosynthesis protein CapA/YwtB (metallophosphatase superfamily)